MIDGDPSGLVTPANVSGLRAGRRVEVRVDKSEYRAEKQTTEVPAHGWRTLSFTLLESMGTVRLQGISEHATVYVDDVIVEANRPLSLPVGTHRLRVEMAGRLFSSTSLEVHPGKQSVPVRSSEGSHQ